MLKFEVGQKVITKGESASYAGVRVCVCVCVCVCVRVCVYARACGAQPQPATPAAIVLEGSLNTEDKKHTFPKGTVLGEEGIFSRVRSIPLSSSFLFCSSSLLILPFLSFAPLLSRHPTLKCMCCA